MSLCALGRRRFPLLFVVVVGALAAVLSSGLTSLQHTTLAGFYVALVAPYTAGAWGRRLRAEAALGCWLCGAVLIAVFRHAPPADLAGAAFVAFVAWTVGRAIRAERELSAALAESSVRLVAEREDRTRLALVDQRTRIARDLHAMVARHVTVMVVQAEGAQSLVDIDLPGAEAVMGTIEETGREALAQMRRLLGVLRTDSDSWQLQPPPAPRETNALRDVYA